MVKSSTESVIITPEPHRGKEKRKTRVGEDKEVLKQKITLPVLLSVCIFNLRGGKRRQKKILAQKKGITEAVIITDGKVEQGLKQITRVYFSCGSHSDVFADMSGSL